MELRSLGGAGLSGSSPGGLDALLADSGVAVPIRHAVSSIVRGQPTPIQSAALTDAVGGRDLLAVAPTGSGKTLVFAIALTHRLAGSPSLPGRPRALVVAPTRELALQSADVIAQVGTGAGLKVVSLVGGQPLAKDRRSLMMPVDVVAGTPGRLVELLRSRTLSTGDLQVLVLDEADQLIGPSFREQTDVLLAGARHSGVLAATATADTEAEAELRALRPGLVVHRVTQTEKRPAEAAAAPTQIQRRLVVLTAEDPEAYAVDLAERCRRALFFVPRRDMVEPLRASIAAAGIPVAGVTGSASPPRRTAAFAELASGAVRVLVTTDLAGRGLDFRDIGHVVHVGPPHSASDLIHRSGRTGRGDSAPGIIAAIVLPSDARRISALADQAGMTTEQLDSTAPNSLPRLAALFGESIAAPRRRRDPAPPARSRRPATSRVHRPKRKRRK